MWKHLHHLEEETDLNAWTEAALQFTERLQMILAQIIEAEDSGRWLPDLPKYFIWPFKQNSMPPLSNFRLALSPEE
jgi:hypothetical protein